jgi:hypothetical protein
VATQPHLVWNAFIDLIATEDYESLSAGQRAAHLAFWYDAEVQNGGHLQYFENSAGTHVEEAIQAIARLGGAHLAAVLQEALERWRSRQRVPWSSAEEFVKNSLEDEFQDLDARYDGARPSMHDLLERYLRENETEFIAYSPRD